MTLASELARIQHAADGITTVFSVPFKFLDDSHLAVYVYDTSAGTESIQTITTHYTVSGAGDESGGSITFVTAPTAGDLITVIRNIPYTQTLNLKENQSLDAANLEESLDKLTMIVQQLEEIAQRGVFVDISSTESPSSIADLRAIHSSFPAKIDGSPTGAAHPFVEQEAATDGTFSDKAGGVDSTAAEYNGCTDDLTDKYVVVDVYEDSDGVNRYWFRAPADCA